MAFFNLKFILAFGYCSISFVIYTLLIIMLLKNWKDFKSAFFRIVIADYFFNLLTWLNSMITLRIPNGTCKDCVLSNLFASLGKDNQYTSSFLFFCYFLHFGNAYFQYFMVTLMSLNRTTSIFFYFVNEKIWKFLFPFSIVLIIGITTFCARTILATSPYYLYNEVLDMYYIKSDSNILPAYYNILYFMAFSVASSIFLNVIAVIRLKMIQNQISSVERNLLLVTIFSSIIQCFAAANTFILQIDVQRATILGQAAQIMLPFASDFLTISQPYILLFVSSKVRTGFFGMYLKKYEKSINSWGFSKTGGFQSGPASRSTSKVTRF
ncbi:Serpentine receptor class gamma [Caenorhabditis elegans]|uniref:Serpentine receptor class gamma n=1 Tax=Caenorhabditis elegans TaxID=6239 RepID=U4PDY0_CAEEL|nr:Serpentine receptor class gamma [Caenorhabditis elegans]CDH92963.1 Serpentine receptor class gamma [Caenorhabditis elegans]|eukprot:NP_001294269.1 Serpentine receptor class gamma [Caenorhabditis elegans]